MSGIRTDFPLSQRQIQKHLSIQREWNARDRISDIKEKIFRSTHCLAGTISPPFKSVTYRQISVNLIALAVLMAVLGLVYWQHTGERAVPELIEALQGRDLQ